MRVSSITIPRQAVILVGGRGTRLGSLTNLKPKPLLEINGKPFLCYLMDTLVRQGIDDILLLSGYQAHEVELFAQNYSRPSVKIQCIVENVPLGTGGALLNAQQYLADGFLVLNGDTLFDINLNDFLVHELGDSIGRIALRRVPDTSRYGRIDLRGKTVEAMREKGVSGEGLINGGIYYIAKSCLKLLPKSPSSLENDLFPKLIAGGLLEGREYDGFFLDIGIPQDFELAQTSVPNSLLRPAVFLDRDGVLNEDKGYVSHYKDLTWIAGAKLAVKHLNDAGFYVFVITNQAGVARGYYDIDSVNDLHNWMQQELRSVGAHIDAFYFCPHHPEFTGVCECRKPASGMILKAINEWPVIIQNSFLIGDKSWDIEAAKGAGISGHLFSGGNLLEFVFNLLACSKNAD